MSSETQNKQLQQEDIAEQESPQEILSDFEIEWAAGLGYLKSDDENSYSIFSVLADVQRGSNGAPMCMLMQMGDGGFLNTSVELGPQKSQTDELKKVLVDTEMVSSEADIILSQRGLQMNRISLLLGDRSGAMQEIAHSQGSGVAPYSALFAVQLDNSELPLVNAALQGEAGLLVAQYDFDLKLPVTVQAQMEVDLRRLREQLREGGVRDPVQETDMVEAVIAALLEEGELCIELATNHASAETLQELHSALITDLLAWLSENPYQNPEGLESDSIRFERSVELEQGYNLKIRSDASSWGATGLEFQE